VAVSCERGSETLASVKGVEFIWPAERPSVYEGLRCVCYNFVIALYVHRARWLDCSVWFHIHRPDAVHGLWTVGEKPVVAQLVKNFPVFCATRMFITVFIRPSLVDSILNHLNAVFNIILCLQPGLPSNLFSPGIWLKCMDFCPAVCELHARPILLWEGITWLLPHREVNS
jgi:hypothetical protein